MGNCGLRGRGVPPELADSVGAVEVGEHRLEPGSDVVQGGASDRGDPRLGRLGRCGEVLPQERDVIDAGTTSFSAHALRRADDAAFRGSGAHFDTGEGPPSSNVVRVGDLSTPPPLRPSSPKEPHRDRETEWPT
jgi:hypothetical protein